MNLEISISWFGFDLPGTRFILVVVRLGGALQRKKEILLQLCSLGSRPGTEQVN